MKKFVFIFGTGPEDISPLAAMLSPRRFQPSNDQYVAFSSLSEASREEVTALVEAEGWAAIEHARRTCEPLVKALSPVWPNTKKEAVEIMAMDPPVLGVWALRNFLFQAACGGFLYLLDKNNAQNLDLTVHLTVAKILKQVTCGVLPAETRELLPTAQMTLTDLVLGEVDTTSLSLVLENLTRGQ